MGYLLSVLVEVKTALDFMSSEVLMMYRWSLNEQLLSPRGSFYACPSYANRGLSSWMLSLDENVWLFTCVLQRMTAGALPSLDKPGWYSKGMLSTFMNFWRKWLANLNPRYFLIEVESLWPTWREKPLSTKTVTLNAFLKTICQPPCLPLLLK